MENKTPKNDDKDIIYLRLPNRMFRICETPVCGFVSLLETSNVDTIAFMKEIGEHNEKDYLLQKLTDTGILEHIQELITTPMIASFMANIHNPLVLDAIIATCRKLYLEELPVAPDGLEMNVREFLKKLDINIEKEILYDRFYSVCLFHKHDPTTPVSYMRQDFSWDNQVGDVAWKALLGKKTFPALIVFEVDSRDDKVVIDMEPEKVTYPIYTEGTDNARAKVSAFVKQNRETNQIGG